MLAKLNAQACSKFLFPPVAHFSTCFVSFPTFRSSCMVTNSTRSPAWYTTTTRLKGCCCLRYVHTNVCFHTLTRPSALLLFWVHVGKGERVSAFTCSPSHTTLHARLRTRLQFVFTVHRGFSDLILTQSSTSVVAKNYCHRAGSHETSVSRGSV